MFAESSASRIDRLNTFDTSSVSNMEFLFQGFNVTSVDLSSFDTSNVNDMMGMFMNSKIKTFDLSSFDTTLNPNMMFMFAGSQATKGYARTSGDAERFNKLSQDQIGLTFTVK